VSARALPAGYERLAVGRAEAVAVPELIPFLRDVLATGTVYGLVKDDPRARELAGRLPAYTTATPMGDGGMVVRHNRHGGALERFTGDRFLYPTRAPYELAVSTRLTAAQVPTPQVLGYVVYRGGVFARSDVITRLVAPSLDLAGAIAPRDSTWRSVALDLTATLVARLSRAGARHADLNAKNILVGNAQPMLAAGSGNRGVLKLLTPGDPDMTALVIDVDRVEFGWSPDDALAANLRRLDRSLRKRRESHGELVTDEEIATMARAAAARL
jgi:3-deoxy-D-manno-octulosonic acid kinase